MGYSTVYSSGENINNHTKIRDLRIRHSVKKYNRLLLFSLIMAA